MICSMTFVAGGCIRMKRIGFLFGAGAELSYNMPLGGKFALDIFRYDTTEAKKEFKKMRESIDPTTRYARNWLPVDYETRNIGTYGKSVFENIIKDTIEHNREKIVYNLNSIDILAEKIVATMVKDGLDVNESIMQLTGREIDDITMKHSISFAKEFEVGNKLFDSTYYSALLLAYSKKSFHKAENHLVVKRVISSILQLQIGALGEILSKRINENPFEKKDDSIDIFDDFGDILRLNYRSSGKGLEYLLETSEPERDTPEGIVACFALKLLEEIFASVMDYKTLIDSDWHYLYCPSVEWNKFCKISIFLITVRNYIESECSRVDVSKGGYYHDLRDAIDSCLIETTAIATSNYTGLITDIIGEEVSYLNGSTKILYDPYVNRLIQKDDPDKEDRFYVPLLFTQSGTKPMTAIEMSKTYVDMYEKFMVSDAICSIGFGFNADDEHINGVIRSLVDNGKQLIIVTPYDSAYTEKKKAKTIAEKLKVAKTDNIKVIYVNTVDRCDATGTIWTELVSI